MPVISTKIRIGLALQSINYPYWVYKMLVQIMNSDFTSIDIVINFGESKDSGKSYSVFTNVLKIESLFFASAENQLTDLSPILSDICHVPPVYFEDNKNLESHPVDLILNLSACKINPTIAPLLKFGIWSFYKSTKETLLPNIIDDIFNKRNEIACYVSIIQPDGKGEIITNRYFSKENDFSALRNIDKYYKQTASFIPDLLRDLSMLGNDCFFLKLNENKSNLSFQSLPQNSGSIGQMINAASYYFDGIKNKILKQFYFEQWFLRFGLQNEGLFPDEAIFKEMIPGKHLDWADPHIVYESGLYHIFIEELLHKRKKGHISVIIMNEKGEYGEPKVIIERPYHLSYPFVFKVEDAFFMIPESAENRTIEMYKCIEFPYKWEYHSILMKDIYAVDSTLLFHMKKWWLFANVKENIDSSSLSFLHIYYSDDLFSGNWTPHPLNPVVSDTASSRPAGNFIFINGDIYRPSQNCVRKYGYGIVLNKILILNENEYKEEKVNAIEPDKSKKILATHTFSLGHNLTVVDARKKRRR